MTERLGGRIAAGAAWMVGFKLLDRSIGIVSMVILARLLLPSDFGLVALATAIIAIVELLAAFSFDIALIQRHDATRAHYDTAWTLNIILAVACALVVALAAFPASVFYDEPRLAPVMGWLAAATLIRGFENIGVVAFRKELELHREFRLLLVKRLGVFVATVAIAVAARSYWALVTGIFLGSVIGVVSSYAMHPFRPRLDLSARSELLHFSKWVLISNVINTLAHRSADLIVGKALGAGPLGLFNLAHEIAHLPTTELAAPINRATYPGYARVASDEARLRAHFLDVQGVTALLTVPAAIGVAAIAPLLVPLLLGEAWREAIPLIAILAVAGLLASWRSNIGYVLLAIGRSDLVSVMNLARLALLVPALIAGTLYFGVAGAAWATLAMAVTMLPITHLFVIRVLRIDWADYMKVLWRPLVAGGAMGIPVRHFAAGPDGGLTMLAATIVLGGVTYVVAGALLWALSGCPASAEAHARDAALAAFRRWRANRA